jgi:hypothetical protein
MSERNRVDVNRLVRLFAVKLTDGKYGYMTGEFDRCHPPSLYMGKLENAMLFEDEKSAVSFVENFEYKRDDYRVECYELHLVHNSVEKTKTINITQEKKK